MKTRVASLLLALATFTGAAQHRPIVGIGAFTIDQTPETVMDSIARIRDLSITQVRSQQEFRNAPHGNSVIEIIWAPEVEKKQRLNLAACPTVRVFHLDTLTVDGQHLRDVFITFDGKRLASLSFECTSAVRGYLTARHGEPKVRMPNPTLGACPGKYDRIKLWTWSNGDIVATGIEWKGYTEECAPLTESALTIESKTRVEAIRQCGRRERKDETP